MLARVPHIVLPATHTRTTPAWESAERDRQTVSLYSEVEK